jgi:hypothetical protein
MRCAQTTPGTDFQFFNDCAKRIPNYTLCTKGFVPMDRDSIQQEVKTAMENPIKVKLDSI